VTAQPLQSTVTIEYITFQLFCIQRQQNFFLSPPDGFGCSVKVFGDPILLQVSESTLVCPELALNNGNLNPFPVDESLEIPVIVVQRN